jgi:thiosulfate reductase cytochrome b subunit
MADSMYLPGLAMRASHRLDSARFSALVRITHWVTTVSFLGLLVSGFAIFIAHPRLYWGETGGLGTPYVLAFPLPFMKGGPSGWGRSLQFLSAWVCILTGILYVLSGIFTRHLRTNLLPEKADLTWKSLWRVASNHLHLRRPTEEDSLNYNVLQRLSYLTVIFVFFPLLIWTGFAMSPAIVSILPGTVTLLGGQETARTIHFFVANFVILFFFVHIAMVCLAGFTTRVGAMITGHRTAKEERP